MSLSVAAFDGLASFIGVLAVVAAVSCCYACLLMQRRANAREERARLADAGARYAVDGRGGAGVGGEFDGGELVETPAARVKIEQL